MQASPEGRAILGMGPHAAFQVLSATRSLEHMVTVYDPMVYQGQKQANDFEGYLVETNDLGVNQAAGF